MPTSGAFALLGLDLDAERDPLEEHRPERPDPGRAEVHLGPGVLELAVADAGVASDPVGSRRWRLDLSGDLPQVIAVERDLQRLQADGLDRGVRDLEAQRLSRGGDRGARAHHHGLVRRRAAELAPAGRRAAGSATRGPS